ncbi:galactokinase [Ruficoccus amylovorans]|uniref:Galactokinase n=1 Tax=Ruficoccus amylovorans TaxID=1804625 RepID=A0A842HAQ2_9BACT|nr:galactokinase [Ruficoccus amylovorans]MBC2593360.1 galactokinase [Ruficoccus amylovorans]
MKEAVNYFKERFGSAPEHVAVAPGRLEFIGNHTDYNGGPVMGLAVDCVMGIALTRTEGDEAELVSQGRDDRVVVPLTDLKPVEGTDGWVNYPMGVFHVLRKHGYKMPGGFRMAVASTLPSGAGMSSSAAFELSAAYAFSSAYGFKADRKQMARYGREAENNFVGMPCGILDQGVSAFGEENHIVKIDCKTETFERVPMPAGVHFWVFNTQKKHALLDSLYATRHKECLEAFDILKVKYPELECLADANLAQLESVSGQLSESLLARARHVITESMRVREMASALTDGDLKRMGGLLLASHESSRHDFENSCDELDFLVDELRQVEGVYGCRLTGGGFGGAVMVVTDGTFSEASAKDACTRYQERFGHMPTVFHTRSGAGAHVVESVEA